MLYLVLYWICLFIRLLFVCSQLYVKTTDHIFINIFTPTCICLDKEDTFKSRKQKSFNFTRLVLFTIANGHTYLPPWPAAVGSYL